MLQHGRGGEWLTVPKWAGCVILPALLIPWVVGVVVIADAVIGFVMRGSR